jgi:hypothetical protein
MYRCVDCGNKVNEFDFQQHETVECPECGIELQMIENKIIGLHIGLSEE